MIIYRAMCHEEAVKTLANGRPDFLKRFKWFSDDLEFVKTRVQDGSFNNSKHKPNRYTRIFEFWIDDVGKVDYISYNEIQFDRRKNPKITLIREVLNNG